MNEGTQQYVLLGQPAEQTKVTRTALTARV